MKATGIVRRIDDLGRVVIPKEIRRTLRIREGCFAAVFGRLFQIRQRSDSTSTICPDPFSANGSFCAGKGNREQSLWSVAGQAPARRDYEV